MIDAMITKTQRDDSLKILTFLRNSLQTYDGVKGINKVEWITLLNELMFSLQYEEVVDSAPPPSNPQPLPLKKHTPLSLKDIK